MHILSDKKGPVQSCNLASNPICIPITLIYSVTGWRYKGKDCRLISIIWISKWGLINYGSHLLSSLVPTVGKFTDSSNATFLEAISKSIPSDSNSDAHFVLPPFQSRRGSIAIQRHLSSAVTAFHRLNHTLGPGLHVGSWRLSCWCFSWHQSPCYISLCALVPEPRVGKAWARGWKKARGAVGMAHLLAPGWRTSPSSSPSTT